MKQRPHPQSVAEISHLSNNKRRHKTWISKYIGKRGQLGAFNTLLPDLCDEVKLYDYLRIDLTTFEELYASYVIMYMYACRHVMSRKVKK